MDLANRRAVTMAIDRLQPQAGESLLDVGCGTGAALAQVARRAPCTMVGVDPSEAMLAMARKRLGGAATLLDASLGSLPLPDAMFDAALALNVLYFCDREGRMLRDLYRVLRPGGRLVAYVTHRDTMQRWKFVEAGLHRLYDAQALRQALAQGGFAIDAVMIHEAKVAPGVRGLFAMATR
ncbi:MAG: class I SAM-dependent methyltransferase [Erythrobacter sp.]|nr:class I SAM-dependent methyltransferase [Erythrobacter sp.]